MLLCDLTTIGRARIAAMADGLVFESAYVAVGTDGYNPGTPTVADPLVPAATALGAEVARFPVPAANYIIDSFLPGAYPGGPTSTGFLATTRLAISGDALADAVGAEATALGEAGLVARITAVGTSGLTLGDEFLLAHCHFPRVIVTRYMKLSTTWPISYTYDVIPLNGLMLWWKFDESSGDALDSSGNAYDFGAMNGFPISTQPSDVDIGRNVIEMQGGLNGIISDQRINDILTAEASLDPDGFTIAYWHKQVSFTNGFGVTITQAEAAADSSLKSNVFQLGGTGPNPNIKGWIVSDGPDGSGFYLYSQAAWGTTDVAVFSGLVSSSWTHIAVTWDKATRVLTMYQDGVATDSVVVDGVGNPVFINDLSFIRFTPVHQFNGNEHTIRVHDMLLYPRALSSTEVDALFQMTA